jgi:DNA repair photolyase
MIGTGSMSDPYMHCEAELGLTRRCLEIIRDQGFGLAIQTKSDRILRDLDLLEDINRSAKCVVQITLTTWDETLCRQVEPHVCGTARRLEVLQRLRDRGIPTLVWLTPLLPFLNDTEENVASILRACADVGVRGVIAFGMGMTLREGSREYFYAALDRHFPGLKRRYAQTYGNAYEVPSPNSPRLMALFHSFCEARGIIHDPGECFAWLAEYPERDVQISMFDG